MENKLNFKNIERQLFRESIRDGIIELQIGIILWNFAIVPYLSEFLGDFWSSATFLITWPVAIYGLRAIRKRYLLPITGKIEYGTYRKKRLKNLNLAMIVFNIIALSVGILSFFQLPFLPDWSHTLRLSIILLMGFSFPGYLLDYPRLYLYGILVAVLPVIGEFLYQANLVTHHGYPFAYGTSGTIIILVGLVDLWTILKNRKLNNLEEDLK